MRIAGDISSKENVTTYFNRFAEYAGCGRNNMNIKVVRMKGKGSRANDRAATIDWKIELDKTNQRIVIKTEQATYYSKPEWICGLKKASLK